MPNATEAQRGRMSWQNSKLVDEVATGPTGSTATANAAAAAATAIDRNTSTTTTVFVALCFTIGLGNNAICHKDQRPWSTRCHQGPPGAHAYTYIFSRALIYVYAYYPGRQGVAG